MKTNSKDGSIELDDDKGARFMWWRQGKLFLWVAAGKGGAHVLHKTMLIRRRVWEAGEQRRKNGWQP